MTALLVCVTVNGCIYVALLYKALYNFASHLHIHTHTWYHTTMQGSGSTIRRNMGFSILPKDMWTGASNHQACDFSGWPAEPQLQSQHSTTTVQVLTKTWDCGFSYFLPYSHLCLLQICTQWLSRTLCTHLQRWCAGCTTRTVTVFQAPIKRRRPFIVPSKTAPKCVQQAQMHCYSSTFRGECTFYCKVKMDVKVLCQKPAWLWLSFSSTYIWLIGTNFLYLHHIDNVST